jgi:hypothetical protein
MRFKGGISVFNLSFFSREYLKPIHLFLKQLFDSKSEHLQFIAEACQVVFDRRAEVAGVQLTTWLENLTCLVTDDRAMKASLGQIVIIVVSKELDGLSQAKISATPVSAPKRKLY